MTTRKVIKGVLNNFLGTFTSRYSEHEGYWLFGILVGSLEQPFQIDLLRPPVVASAAVPLIIAAQVAVTKLDEQVRKAGLPLSCMREAELIMTRSAGTRERSQENGTRRECYEVRFCVRVVSDRAKTYEAEKVVFVAPHDPRKELRSARSTPP